MRPIGNHAVVLGASMAGLATARVLADAYGRVTVLDRDTFPAAGEHRRGVPQSRHAHGLLAGGRAALEELFSGLTDELVAAGALVADVQADLRWYNDGLRLRQAPAGLAVLMVSRPLLEGRVRDRVRRLGNVRVVDRCQVTGLAATPDGRGVGGVRAIGRAGRGEELVRADLVVDATGRGSRSPAWLAELGYQPPVEERVPVGITYTTRVYRRRPDHLGGDVAAVVGPTPELRRGGGILATEGDRWIVTLFGYLGRAGTGRPGGLHRLRGHPVRARHLRGHPGRRATRRGASPATRPACAGASGAETGSRTASWSSGTRGAASTRSTGRA